MSDCRGDSQLHRLQPVFRKCFHISKKTLFALNDCIAGLGSTDAGRDGNTVGPGGGHSETAK